MKILILGAFNPGALENYYFRGLQRAGADCSHFDIAADYYNAISRSLLNKVINKLDGGYFSKDTNKKVLDFFNYSAI